MFKKYILRAARPLGIFLIFSVSVACIFMTLILRDMDYTTSWAGKLTNFTVSFENRFYDLRMKNMIDSDFKSKEQVLIRIDDYSLENFGKWPLPRTVYAEFIRKLKVRGAKVVGMDVLFPEESQSCGGKNPDQVLKESFSDFRKDGRHAYIAYTIDEDPNLGLTELPDELFDNMANSQTSPGSAFKPFYINKFNYPIPAFTSAGVGLGYIDARQDSDGVFRNYRLAANVSEIYVGSLGLNVYDAYADVENKSLLKIQKDGEGTLVVNNKKMETTDQGESKIRWVGSLEQFPWASLYDFNNTPDDDPAMTALVNNKIVFLGSTANGAHDLRPSPVDSLMPGVLSHMNLVHMLIHKNFYQPQDISVQYSLFLLILGSLIFWAASRLGYASIDLITLVAMIAGSFLADRYYFLPNGYELKLFYCYFCYTASYSWNTFLNFSEANKEKKQVRGTFARYVAPTIVDEMLKDPEKLVVGGFRRDITCLFSDVRDFTSISEGLSPTELAQSLNMYMGKMTDIVFETKGTLDKYIGDAIVAFWGAPLEIGNHAQFAVEGALKMMEILPKINEEFRKLNRPEFNIGIGLNSGECNVGNMGSSRIFSYTALGDNMNLGARLESLCKHYGTQILISEYTLARLDTTHIRYRPIDNVVVKGKTTPVAVFEIIHSHHFMSQNNFAYESFLAAHSAFLSRKFQEAADLFKQVLDMNETDKASKRFKEMCEKFAKDPELAGENFSVTVMTEK